MGKPLEPVAVVHRVTDEDEAVALANDSPYGLGGSVFGADVQRARRVADRIDIDVVLGRT
ncbi:MAG: succinate-semialdehyde dehydrogenase / glutarate-semialdehyde dehydrogenase [Solirubrobacteraceae bacterium]|nr:succinate-semialdehyde dehydrogenase / glutarate-semialdehyde dehydrogenase [Solirubrobacteraceae bacterium]